MNYFIRHRAIATAQKICGCNCAPGTTLVGCMSMVDYIEDAIGAHLKSDYFISTEELIEDNCRLRRAIAYARKRLTQEPSSTKPCWQILAEARSHLSQVLALPGEP